jgi:hypothetical protein
MTTSTPNLSMTLYNSTTDASAITFSTFRAGIAGISPTSNFNLLDTYAGLVSASLLDQKNRSVYVVPAIYVSPNYYEANSVTGFTSYNSGQLIDLSLDTTSGSSTTVNINALGAKALKKIDSSGSTIDVTTGDIEKNKEYLFRYTGSYWMWIAIGGGTGTASIAGSGIMSDTTGSVVKHNVSGVTPGNYTALNATIDSEGHITVASNGASASSTGVPSDSPFYVSGSVSGLTNAKMLIPGTNTTFTTNGSTVSISSASPQYGGMAPITVTNTTITHDTSGVVAGTYNRVTTDNKGHITSGSDVAYLTSVSIAGSGVMSDTSGSVVKHNVSGATAGNYTAANITIDSSGHVTAASNGTSGSSSGAPSDSPFYVSGSVSGLTNAKMLIPGTNVSFTPSGSTTSVSSSTNIAGSGVVSDSSGSVVKHNTSGVVAGTYTLSSTTIDSMGHVTSASSGMIASANQVSSGSSATALVSASGLSQSNYGVKTVCIPLNTTVALAGGETNYARIPQYMNGWKLVDAAASCGAPNGSGSSTSGSPSFTLKRSSASSMTQVSLITNVITIDASEFDSSTSSSPVVISALNTVLTGDKIWAATSASGTGVTYVEVSPTFRNMP